MAITHDLNETDTTASESGPSKTAKPHRRHTRQHDLSARWVTAAGRRVTRTFDWAFRSRTNGRVAIAQWPNLALWIVIACDVTPRLVHLQTGAHQDLHWAGTAAVLWWSIDELVRGVNPFRRILGAVVLARVIIRIVDPGSALG
jgi:hypothetical protein